MGNNSNLPATISIDKTILENGEKAEKLLDEPAMLPKAGPTLLIQVKEAVKLVTKSKSSTEIISETIIKTKA